MIEKYPRKKQEIMMPYCICKIHSGNVNVTLMYTPNWRIRETFDVYFNFWLLRYIQNNFLNFKQSLNMMLPQPIVQTNFTQILIEKWILRNNLHINHNIWKNILMKLLTKNKPEMQFGLRILMSKGIRKFVSKTFLLEYKLQRFSIIFRSWISL